MKKVKELPADSQKMQYHQLPLLHTSSSLLTRQSSHHLGYVLMLVSLVKAQQCYPCQYYQQVQKTNVASFFCCSGKRVRRWMNYSLIAWTVGTGQISYFPGTTPRPTSHPPKKKRNRKRQKFPTIEKEGQTGKARRDVKY